MSIRSNDDMSFEKVYVRAFSSVMKVSYNITYDKDVSEEICQEAFIRFYNKALLLPNEDEALYWLIRVAKNLSLNYVKRKGREKKILNSMNKKENLSYNPVSSEQMMRAETKDQVRAALETLPENLKIVMILREYGDLNYDEIAKILQISLSNVKVRIYRARKAIQSLLNWEDLYVSK